MKDMSLKRSIKNFQIQQDLSTIKLLHLGHFLCLTIGIFFRQVVDGGNILALLTCLILIPIYKMHLKTIENLYYTFWTFSFLIFSYFLSEIYFSLFPSYREVYFYLNALGALLIALECYILSSPIFFPRVAWWEYDFRYIGDLKVELISNRECFEGRLTDLRREAGCIVAFKEKNIGDKISVKVDFDNVTKTLEGEIVSRREVTLGRGITYGIKFYLRSNESRDAYHNLAYHWRSIKKMKRQLKFEKNEN